ncbi:MAG: lipoyl domain-containing protein [Candidatus Omnitrophota bacterium]
MNVVLPQLGGGIGKATIAFWHCSIGDFVKKDDDLVEVATDKAIFNIPAGAEGIVKEIYVKTGEDAAVGSILARIEISKLEDREKNDNNR